MASAGSSWCRTARWWLRRRPKRKSRMTLEAVHLRAEATHLNTRRIAGRVRFLAPILLGFSLLIPNPACGQSSERPEPADWFAGDAHVHRGIGCGRSNEKEM